MGVASMGTGIVCKKVGIASGTVGIGDCVDCVGCVKSFVCLIAPRFGGKIRRNPTFCMALDRAYPKRSMRPDDVMNTREPATLRAITTEGAC